MLWYTTLALAIVKTLVFKPTLEVLMTIGNVTYSQFTEGVGKSDTKTWAGDDRLATVRTRFPRPTPVFRTFYCDAATGRIVPSDSPRAVKVQRASPKFDERAVATAAGLEPHAYTMRREIALMPSGAYLELQDGVYVQKREDPSSGYFMHFNHAEPDPSRVWELRAKVIGDLYSQVAGSGFNATVFASQTAQTLGGIASAAETLAASFKQLKRGNFYGAAKRLLGTDDKILRRHPTAKDVSGRWLELQYGWLPLLSDIKESGELIAHNLDNAFDKGAIVRVRKQFRQTDPLGAYWVKGRHTVKYSINCSARLIPLSKPQLLGLMDPLSVVWENVPYSFVVDWFYPVGDYLQALNQSHALSGTFVTSELIRLENTYESYNGTTWKYVPYGTCSKLSTTLTRSVSQSLQIGIPPLHLGGIKSLKRAANAASLLLQSFSK